MSVWEYLKDGDIFFLFSSSSHTLFLPFFFHGAPGEKERRMCYEWGSKSNSSSGVLKTSERWGEFSREILCEFVALQMWISMDMWVLDGSNVLGGQIDFCSSLSSSSLSLSSSFFLASSLSARSAPCVLIDSLLMWCEGALSIYAVALKCNFWLHLILTHQKLNEDESKRRAWEREREATTKRRPKIRANGQGKGSIWLVALHRLLDHQLFPITLQGWSHQVCSEGRERERERERG